MTTVSFTKNITTLDSYYTTLYHSFVKFLTLTGQRMLIIKSRTESSAINKENHRWI